MYVCMYVCVCMCIYIYIYTYVYLSVYLSVCPVPRRPLLHLALVEVEVLPQLRVLDRLQQS